MAQVVNPYVAFDEHEPVARKGAWVRKLDAHHNPLGDWFYTATPGKFAAHNMSRRRTVYQIKRAAR